MEPIRLWRVYCDGWNYTDDEEVSKIGEPIAALPRADFDALVKRDRTCPLCGDELDPDEADYDSVCPPAGAGVCSRCFARWHDAPVYEKRATAATARADAASERLERAEALVAAAANATSVHADLVALLMEASDLMFDRELFPVCNSAAPLRWRERVDSILEKPNG